MKTEIRMGIFITGMLGGCAQKEQMDSTSLPARPLPVKSIQVSPDRLIQTAKIQNVNSIDALSNHIDEAVAKKVYTRRLFAGFLANPEQTKLDWEQFKSEQQRQNASGYPDTCMDVWLERNQPILVSSERGMTSGIGWWERSKYYFRSNGTLAKLIFSRSPGVGMGSLKLVRYYNQKEGLIHSSASSNLSTNKNSRKILQEIQTEPEIYFHTKSLPIHHFFKARKKES